MKKLGIWLAGNVEQVILLVTASSAIVFISLGHTGLFRIEDANLPEFIVALLSLIGLLLSIQGLTVKSRLADIENAFDLNTKTLIQSVAGVRYKSFDNNTDIVRYLTERILQAKQSVADLTWVKEPPLALGKRAAADKQYYEAIVEVSKKIQYREIFIFTDREKVDKLKMLVEKNTPFYYCGYYPMSPVRRPTFTIIDNEEVFLYGPGVFCSFYHPELTKAFTRYYEGLWHDSTKIKEGTKICKPEYDKILQLSFEV